MANVLAVVLFLVIVATVAVEWYAARRVRPLRRPGAPSWKFWSGNTRFEDELYEAGARVWLERAGVALAVRVIAFFLLVAVVVIGGPFR